MQPASRLSREEREMIDRVTRQAETIRARFAREMDALLGELAARKGGPPPPPPPPPVRPPQERGGRA